MQFARILKSPSNPDIAPSHDQARSIAISGSRDLRETVPTEFEQDWAGQGYHNQGQAPAVTVNNNGQYYRPWREELGISFGRTLGNFFAFPIRLVGGVFSGIANGIVGIGMTIVKLIVMAIIMPTLIYTGFQMYEAKQNGESSTEVAAEVAGEAIGLAGAALGGIWDAIVN